MIGREGDREGKRVKRKRTRRKRRDGAGAGREPNVTPPQREISQQTHSTTQHSTTQRNATQKRGIAQPPQQSHVGVATIVTYRYDHWARDLSKDQSSPARWMVPTTRFYDQRESPKATIVRVETTELGRGRVVSWSWSRSRSRSWQALMMTRSQSP